MVTEYKLGHYSTKRKTIMWNMWDQIWKIGDMYVEYVGDKIWKIGDMYVSMLGMVGRLVTCMSSTSGTKYGRLVICMSSMSGIKYGKSGNILISGETINESTQHSPSSDFPTCFYLLGKERLHTIKHRSQISYLRYLRTLSPHWFG